MSEFRIHHDVNELLSLLRVHGGDGAEVYIDLLQKNRTPYVTTTVSAHSAKVSTALGVALMVCRVSAVPGSGCRVRWCRVSPPLGQGA
uniref:Tubulin gamma complex component 2 n=2 Tax=Cercopithecinae TaxID=9528 RepID=A0A2K5MPC4_CERAT